MRGGNGFLFLSIGLFFLALGLAQCGGGGGGSPNPVVTSGGATCSTEVCDYVDNNCDGVVDEGFPDKFAACTVGVGACQNVGVMVCTSDGLGTECNVAPKAASTELCNGVDDDCNGQTDETFANKGNACSVGLGACLAVGVFVCTSDGLGTQCSATPGTPGAEICGNGIDDNCNGQTDEPGCI